MRYAAPKEGFRGWGGGNAILTHVKGDKLDAAYDYLNWWNTPVPAGIMATQGYYNANISASHKGLTSSKALGGVSADNYWLKGKAATTPLVGPVGKTGHQDRRQARRRLLRAALRPLLRLELAGQEPRLPAPEVAGVHHRVSSGSALKPKARRSGRPHGRPLHAVVHYPQPSAPSHVEGA